ncbi:MAG: TonB-dependent receptor [Bacteroidota bacterium]
MRKLLLILFIGLFTTGVVFAQDGSVVRGKLLDAQTKEPLIGATVTVKGTTNAIAAALDGSFKITAPSGSTLVITYIGYVTKEINVTGTKLGEILVDPVSASMKEVVIAGSSSLAIDRQTPVAVSSVGSVYIEEKGAGAEFPELLKATPGVTVSRAGGGYGDSRIAIRGFNSNNIALLVNGIPVNDVEAGKLFWNDWAGLADVTTSMQVQRGLGAAKIAVPSLGGTIDIRTRSTEREEGGSVSQSIGSYNALKTSISYATGLTPKGWASSFLLSKATGDGNAEGLYYTGYSYFFNLSKVIGKSQTLAFSFMGASQIHGQRYTYQSINAYRAAPQGIRYNSDYGYLDGQLLSAEQNYYNKPLAQLVHTWIIDETSSLSTIAYWSSGRGAARYISGGAVGLGQGATTNAIPRTGDIYSPIDFNQIVKNNRANADGSSTTYFNEAVNNHIQTGLLSTYKKKLNENFNLSAGLDLRTYNGDKFYRLNSLLGGTYLVDKTDLNNPSRNTVVGDYLNNHYRYLINTYGGYLTGEYVKDQLSAFVTVGANNTGNKRIDYFSYLNTDPNRESKVVNFFGYQVKGGANYNIDASSNVFANIGYLERPPYVASIFLNKKNDLNPQAVNEKLMSYELGYQFRSSQFSANVNLYRSTYKDRAKNFSTTANQDGSIPTYNVTGINELHQGIEIDAKYRPISDVTISGMLSIGDYHYTSNTGSAQITSDAPGAKTFNVPALILKNLPIGDFGGSAASNAQTTAALGLDVKVLPSVKLGANANYFGRFFASYDPSKMVTVAPNPATNDPGFDPTAFKPYQLPNYATFDLNLVYRFKFAGLDASFIGNVYNVLNTAYLAEGYESGPTNGSAVSRLSALGVNYGNGRLYMTTLKIKF